MASLPFGPLVCFGNYWASPQVKPVLSFVNMSGPISNYKPDWAPQWPASTGSKFPLDPYGFGPSPYASAMATWPYLLKATAFTTGTTAYSDVEAQWAAIKAWRDGTYALSDGYTKDPCSGEVGWLTVLGADQASKYQVWAKMAPLPAKLLPGYNTLHYVPPLTFQLLGDFTEAAGDTHYGAAHYGVAHYS